MTATTTKHGARIDGILIAGATASGKSGLALALARALDGIVINADSMQVYRDLRILTARPTRDHTALAPHRLYGVLAGNDPCSAGRFAALARDELARAHALGKLPVLVGGSGLYFKALEEGIAPMPEISPDVRAAVREDLHTLGPERFRDLVAACDPAFVQSLAVLDPQRMSRALEVYRQTGHPLSDWQQCKTTPVLSGRYLKLVVERDRAALYQRCDARFLEMVDDGAVAEVERLLALGLDPAVPVMKAVGVPELAAHLRGEISLDAAIARAQTATRRLAKRQLTWIRGNMISWKRFNAQDMERNLNKIFAFIHQAS